jgi:ATP-dependent DNA helicase DinG
MLRAALGERPLIAVSATLSVGGSFVPLARAMGLPPGSWDGVDLGTPFDYDRQAMLYIPGATFPVPAGQQRTAHTEAVREELLALIGAAGGRTLALFTTTAAARDAGAFLRGRLPMTVLVQGDEPPKRLVERFVAEETSVLCATMGMWQGTDAPGATCILVVLDKIPFPPVDDPLLQARRAAADENGRSGFADVDLVHAGVRLAQGAGRLVRTSQDRGVVAILDPRLVTRRYGTTLRAGLPMRRLWHDRSVVEGALKRLAADAGPAAGSAPTEDTTSDRPKPRARPRRRTV